jgi:hypothetical protein
MLLATSQRIQRRATNCQFKSVDARGVATVLQVLVSAKAKTCATAQAIKNR